ncbi:flagellin [Limnohabitans sp. 2KL-3]|uniref:flagellin N-terminal helical domain-containing protein n=1 Tax=Limnohabitans sp. 2KL-3 TaxID=1100700 RepID=UPI000A8ADFFC|nr:flagellin [Limnohabitans sp. 2KL-3]
MTVINTNVKSLISQNALIRNNRAVETSMEQLSTGKRINSSADDATGMAITNRMTSQIRGLDQAVRNANDGISLIQTVEGSLNEVNSMLQRMRELSIQSANDTNTVEDRGFLDMEFQELKQEINRVAKNTQWNGMDVLNKSATAGNGAGKFEFQVGANANQLISIQLQDFRTDAAVASNVELKNSAPAKAVTPAQPAVVAQPQVSTLTLSGAYQAGAAATTGTGATGIVGGDTIKLEIGTKSITYTVKPTDIGTTPADTLTLIRNSIVSTVGIENDLGVVLTSEGTDKIKFTGPTGVNFTPKVTTSFSTAGQALVGNETVGSVSTKESNSLTLSGQYQEGDIITLKNGSNEFKYQVTSADATASKLATPTYAAMATNIIAAVTSGKLGSATATSAVAGSTAVITFTASNYGANTLDLSAQASTSTLNAGKVIAGTESLGTPTAQEFNTLTLAGSYQKGDVITLKNGAATLDYTVTIDDAADATLNRLANSIVAAASGKLEGTLAEVEGTAGVKFTALTVGANKLDLSATVKNANLFATQAAKVTTPEVFTSAAAAQVDELSISGRFDSGDKVKLTLNGIDIEYTVSDADANGNNPNEAVAKGLTLKLEQATPQPGVAFVRSGSSITFTGNANGTAFTSNVSINRVNPQVIDGKPAGSLNMIAQSSLTTSANAQAAIASLDDAIAVISESRANMGAVMNRLTFAADNLINVAQNSTESRSRILDTDFAKASSELARTQIISQAATSVLAQANQSTQSVMKLLQG